jgi:hypothetical protein
MVFFYVWVVSKILIATLFYVGGETVSLILLLLTDTTLISLLGAVFLVNVMTHNDSVTMSNWLSCYKSDPDHSLPGLPTYNEQ